MRQGQDKTGFELSTDEAPYVTNCRRRYHRKTEIWKYVKTMTLLLARICHVNKGNHINIFKEEKLIFPFRS
jgi:hypothetical protein